MKNTNIIYSPFHFLLDLFSKNILILFVLLLVGSFSLKAQVCSSGETVLVKWDFNSNNQECNGINANRVRYWIPSVPLMTGGNQYCPQINDGSGQALLFEKGFGNTNDFKNMQCLAGFWKNSGNKYFRAPGYDHTSTTYNAENPSGNVWMSYNFLAGQVGSLTGFDLNYSQAGYRDGNTIAFDKVGMSVWRNGIKIYETTTPITAAHVNNGSNPITFDFPNTPDFSTDGNSAVKWEIGFAMVKRNRVVRVGADNYCIRGTTGAASPNVSVIPADCTSASPDGKLTVLGFSSEERSDYNQGGTYTGSATYATATPIPSDGVIANDLPLVAVPTQYTVRIFRADCYTETVVLMPATICPFTCDFPQATTVGNPATCTGTNMNSDATIVMTSIIDMDRVGISLGKTYTGPNYAGASLLNGATTFTFDSSDGVVSAACTQYYTLRFFNGAENSDLCIKDVVVSVSGVLCDGCDVICADVVNSDSEDNNETNDTDQAEFCKTNDKVDLRVTKTVNPSAGENCPNETSFVFSITVENIGGLTANDVIILDDFPDEMIITGVVTTSGIILEGFGTLDWSIPQIAPSGVTTLTITGAFLEPGDFINCANVKSVFPVNDPDNTNDTSCVNINVIGNYLPTIEKAFSPTFAKANVPIRLKIEITNNEEKPIALTQDLVDNLPSSPGQMLIATAPSLTSSVAGVIAIAGDTKITIPSGTLLQSGLNTIYVDVIAPADGDYSNLILPGDLQTTACSNPDTALATLYIASDFVLGPMISKTFDKDCIEVGQSSIMTITIENRNNEDFILAADFVDELPDGLIYSTSPTSSCGGVTDFGSNNRIGLLEGTVISGNSNCVIEVSVEGTIAGMRCNRILFNDMPVMLQTTPPTMTINEDIAEACIKVVTDPIFDLALIKKLSPAQLDTVDAGDTVSFEITVFNQGTVTATNIEIIEYIPSGFVLVPDANWQMVNSSAELIVPIASLLAGNETTITINLRVDDLFTGLSLVNTAEIKAAVGGVDIDSTPNDNSMDDNGGLVRSSSDNVLLGNGFDSSGAPQDAKGLSDEDDQDPEMVVVNPNCVMSLTATASSCVVATNNYTLTGDITFANPPATGTMTVEADGGTQVFNSPFSSPQAYSIDDLDSDGATHTVSVSFSDDATCTGSTDYLAPEACAIVPISCTITGTNITCNGGNDGEVVATGTGGGGTYEYSLNGGAFQVSGTFSGLMSALQTVTVRDAADITNTSTCSIALTQPTAVTCTITSSTNPSSPGASDGSLTVSGTGGSSTFEYRLNGGAFQASGTFTGLSAGLQTITVRDANANICTSTCSVTLVDPVAVSCTIQETNITCNGGTDGQVIATGTGGSGSFEYRLNGGTFQASGTFTGLSAGLQTITVRDSNATGNTSTCTATLTEPPAVTCTIDSSINPSFPGASDGSLTVSGTGGSSTFEYSLNGGTFQASGTFTGLSAGLQTITVRDANATICTSTCSVTLVDPSGVSCTIQETNITCNGGSDGQVVATGTGGSGSFEYSLNGGVFQVSGTFTGLSSGLQEITVRDSNATGNTSTCTATLTEPPAVTCTIDSSINPSFPGASDGSLTVSGTGGSSTFEYSLNGGTFQASGTFTGLSAGLQTITVRDANATICTSTCSVTLVDPSGVSCTIQQTNITCNGGADGQVIATGTGGSGSFEYSLDGGTFQASGTFTGLSAGLQTITVRDSNATGNTSTCTATLTEPPAVSCAIDSSINPSFPGASDGSLTVSGTGGSSAFEYSLNGGAFQASGTFTGLSAGLQEITVRDANATICTNTCSVTLVDPVAVSCTIQQTNITCGGGSDGQVVATGTGGGGSFEYSLNGGTFQVSGTFTGLSVGLQTITVRDSNAAGNTSTCTATLTEPPAVSCAIDSSINPSFPGASDGSLTVSGTGGSSAFEYSLNGVTFQVSGTFSGLGAGLQTITVRDANANICTNTCSVTLVDPVAVSCTIQQTNITCGGGSDGQVVATGTGGGGSFEYSLNGGTFQVSGTFTGLSAGLQEITVRDSNATGNTSTCTATLTEPPAVTCTIDSSINPSFPGASDGSLTVSGTGGSSAFEYSLNGGTFQASGTFTGLSAGLQEITVRDANANICTSMCSVTLVDPVLPCDFLISHTQLSTCNGGNFDANLTVDWQNGPLTGGFEYKVDNGSFQPLARSNFSANALSEPLVIPNLTCEEVKMIEIRFENDNSCYTQMAFLFPPADPAGHIYCTETGEVIAGGTISVTPPPGGSINIIEDGSTGYYEWLAVGSPVVSGLYTMTYSPPAGYSNTGTAGDRVGDTDDLMDPTAGSEDNPTNQDPFLLGSDVDGTGTALQDFSASGNPFFVDFMLELGDPFVDLNNLPLVGCMVDCPPNENTICSNNTNTATLTAEAGLTNVVWFEYDEVTMTKGVQVGTGSTFTVVGTDIGPAGSRKCYVYEGTDADGCPGELCCPICITTEECCPDDNCFNVNIILPVRP